MNLKLVEHQDSIIDSAPIAYRLKKEGGLKALWLDRSAIFIDFKIIYDFEIFVLKIIYDLIYDYGMKQDQPVKNKQQYAYEMIRSRILDGRYVPGQRIVIDQIAREIGTSIIPVREAIRLLEADGLIEYKPYVGPIVGAIDEEKYIETLTVLAVMEGYATALSAEHLTSDDFVRLEELNEAMKTALDEFDFQAFGELNRQFHAIIYQKCGNSFLMETLQLSWQKLDHIRKSGFAFVPKRARESLKEHEQLIRYLKEKAPFRQIEEFAREHKMNTVRAFQNREK